MEEQEQEEEEQIKSNTLSAVTFLFFDKFNIFDMYIGVVPRSSIGILEFSNLIIKDHLWTR